MMRDLEQWDAYCKAQLMKKQHERAQEGTEPSEVSKIMEAMLRMKQTILPRSPKE